MVIMLVPLLLFFVGLFSIDQYRTTLIQSEFIALERQGFTLARSLALAEAERDIGAVRRRLSPETMNHLLPLVAMARNCGPVFFSPMAACWLIPRFAVGVVEPSAWNATEERVGGQGLRDV